MNLKTRAEIKKDNQLNEKTQKERDKKRKQVEHKYQKKLEKEGLVTKSRKSENDKIRDRGRKLDKIILVVTVLLIIVLAIVFIF
ncbi:cell wall synthase accessory phosphoprotein MacP [Carnobacterium pleistocenium]|uniref:cell wall synthase accessory phosphoprotein MacP n=1 Tax=Carnobacterium pleistocenium TaxID=181073 RepID=UPI000552202D|nr:cell wall synthase accessory phosphoprotein MacP [Carnobacterium pleistocenium]